MLKLKTVNIIAKPGKNACHQRPAKTPSRASDKIFPQVGVGSGIPALINDNEASNTIASAIKTIVNTSIGAAQFLATCLNKIHGDLAPLTTAARA